MSEHKITKVRNDRLNMAKAKLGEAGYPQLISHIQWLIDQHIALEAKLSKMEARLLSVLEVAVARGEKLGYEDVAYRKDLEKA